jgi:glycerophosphoryl diester phosphodiesterase
MQQEKKKVLVWTVNNRVQMKKFADWSVDGIISDETRMLGETLGLATHTGRERTGSGKRD